MPHNAGYILLFIVNKIRIIYSYTTIIEKDMEAPIQFSKPSLLQLNFQPIHLIFSTKLWDTSFPV